MAEWHLSVSMGAPEEIPPHAGKTFAYQACPNNSLFNSNMTDWMGEVEPQACLPQYRHS